MVNSNVANTQHAIDEDHSNFHKLLGEMLIALSITSAFDVI